jgi:hypothetical protein
MAIQPRSFYRRNEHFELYENLLLDRGGPPSEVRHLLLPSALSARNSRTTRAARSTTPVSSPASRSRIFYWAIRQGAVSGSGGAVRMGVRTGYTCSRRMTGECDGIRPSTWGFATNITHMQDVANGCRRRPAGARFVIASDDSGNNQRRSQTPCLQSLPLPYVTSA